MKILVTGSNGQLGSELKLLSALYRQFDFTFIDVEEVNLAEEVSIRAYFADKHFDFLIHCAAYTAVDKAEEEVALAYAINAGAVKTLAEICLEKKIRLIHISTDYVFDGEANQPITETVQPNPVSVYGKSKLEGEHHVLSILSNAYVIRTAWVYSSFGKNFVKSIRHLASQREMLGVVCDQIGTPTYAYDLASALLQIVDAIHRGQADEPGVYHFTNEGVTSWYDFAYFLVQESGLNCRIQPISTAQYKTAAVRPKFSLLDKSKIKATFAVQIPHWSESLKICIDKLNQGA
ncbi:dTDP-4-dehydrorhamnose reductase [Chryseolinea serpens]|uniref:dTDP-4-dehydrorhamnose reductase n=1 Tax=Chryseolinea serpens TaxID=947013 RepID=A0A1M5NS30_9BACT|nr:dTDP-4-dehydrorhamnose reductase [Chryseolinea serpens]SHG92342.1 dTDP-4-dehydrorhamnose reductase [Chryseolinea serpens]